MNRALVEWTSDQPHPHSFLLPEGEGNPRIPPLSRERSGGGWGFAGVV